MKIPFRRNSTQSPSHDEYGPDAPEIEESDYLDRDPEQSNRLGWDTWQEKWEAEQRAEDAMDPNETAWRELCEAQFQITWADMWGEGDRADTTNEERQRDQLSEQIASSASVPAATVQAHASERVEAYLQQLQLGRDDDPDVYAPPNWDQLYSAPPDRTPERGEDRTVEAVAPAVPDPATDIRRRARDLETRFFALETYINTPISDEEGWTDRYPDDPDLGSREAKLDEELAHFVRDNWTVLSTDPHWASYAPPVAIPPADRAETPVKDISPTEDQAQHDLRHAGDRAAMDPEQSAWSDLVWGAGGSDTTSEATRRDQLVERLTSWSSAPAATPQAHAKKAVPEYAQPPDDDNRDVFAPNRAERTQDRAHEPSAVAEHNRSANRLNGPEAPQLETPKPTAPNWDMGY